MRQILRDMVYRMRSYRCWGSYILKFSSRLRAVVRTSGFRQLLPSSKATTLIWLFLYSSSTLWENPYHPSGNRPESNIQWSITTSKITWKRPATATVPMITWDKESRWCYSSPITSMIQLSSLYLGVTRRRPPHSLSSTSVGSG